MTDQHPGGHRHVRYDPTITLGHLIQLVAS